MLNHDIPEARTFKIIVEYDGTDFQGWQRQKSGRTVQAEIEKALETMTGQRVVVNGSGRTDAGVHAHGQAASFRCRTGLAPRIFLSALNSLLPDDMAVKECMEMPAGFHARFDARSKAYQYRIVNRPIRDAIGRRFAWFIRTPLDMDNMANAAAHLVGTLDFSAFESTGSPRRSSVRTVFRADMRREGMDCLTFTVEADGFLRYMVRSIVGTLVQVGRGKLTPDDFRCILDSRDRRLAGATAPPQGLCLLYVRYGEVRLTDPHARNAFPSFIS